MTYDARRQDGILMGEGEVQLRFGGRRRRRLSRCFAASAIEARVSGKTSKGIVTGRYRPTTALHRLPSRPRTRLNYPVTSTLVQNGSFSRPVSLGHPQ
jgi:hypothetical protein